MWKEAKEHGKLAGCLTLWWLWAIVLVIVATGIYFAVRPYFLEQFTKQNQNSYEYVTTKQDILIQRLAEWEKIDAQIAQLSQNEDNKPAIVALRSNQAAIVLDMHQQAARLLPSQIPYEVAQFFLTH